MKDRRREREREHKKKKLKLQIRFTFGWRRDRRFHMQLPIYDIYMTIKNTRMPDKNKPHK